MTLSRSPGTAGRKIRSVLVVVLFGLAATGCSGGDSAPADLAGVKKQLAEAGITCDGAIEPYVRSKNEVDLGVDPTESFECTVDGVQLQGTGFASAEDREKAVQVSTTLVCGVAGATFSYVADGPWMVTAERAKSRTSDTDLLERIADATATSTATIECSDEPGGIHGTSHTGSTATTAP